MALLLRVPVAVPSNSISFHPRQGYSLYQTLHLNLNPTKMATNTIKISHYPTATGPSTAERKLPILLFDIMDTIVRDPFYQDIPAFFGMSFEELIECKHPTAWLEFEKSMIDEDQPMKKLLPALADNSCIVLYEIHTTPFSLKMELARKFFKDGRHFNLEGLKTCMRSGYSFVEGIEQLLITLKQNNYEMHAFTNYPIWYQLIEDKLKLSKYLSWTFCSCTSGKRKPDPDFYREVLSHLQVDAPNCIFIDDRLKNVETAIEVGIRGVHFKNANSLHEELSLMGIDI